MVSSWIPYCNNFSLQRKMEVAHPSKLIKKKELIYYDRNDEASLNSLFDLSQEFSKMSYKDTIYLGVVPINETLPKTGYGHFYLYHLYNKDFKSIMELDVSLKLFAIIKTSPNIGLHIPVVKKLGYTTTSTSMKNYYALGTFEDNKRKFESIDKLIDYYKQVTPKQIIKENKKYLKNCKVIETRIDTPSVINRYLTPTDSSLLSDIKNQFVNDNDYENVTKKNTSKGIYGINDKKNAYSDTSILLSRGESNSGASCKRLKSKCYNLKNFTDSQKWEFIKALREQKCYEDELKSKLTSESFKSTDSSSKLMKKFDIRKKNKIEKINRNEDFYVNYFLGLISKKESKKKVKQPFDFAFYLRQSKKSSKKILYLVYKPLKGKTIHLRIIKKRNPNYGKSKDSVKRFYAVKTPYKTYDYFYSYKEMVDYYYDRIEKVKELYYQFIR
uniref:Replication protein n=1 Tax=Strongyloides stercoralis TaxID=6248 RepID=A0A0K0EJ11_STRER